MNWPFADPPRTAVFTLWPILKQTEAIRLVIHDHDGDWQFLDGVTDATAANAAIVALQEIADRDPSVLALADLPCGWKAVRGEVGEGWRREAFEVRELAA